MKVRQAVLPLVVALVTAPVSAYAGDFGKYLSVADVEKVSGLTGVKVAPMAYANPNEGHLFVSDAKGKTILDVFFESADQFSARKRTAVGVKDLVGVGDLAFISTTSLGPFEVVFKKGPMCVHLLAVHATDLNGKPGRLPVEQVTSLAKLVASRI